MKKDNAISVGIKTHFCYYCGSVMEEVEKVYEYEIFGHDINVEYLELKCPACKVTSISGRQMEELDKKLFSELMKHTRLKNIPSVNLRYIVEYVIRLMAGDEFKDAKYYHMSIHHIFYEIKKYYQDAKKFKNWEAIENLMFTEHNVYPSSDLIDDEISELDHCNIIKYTDNKFIVNSRVTLSKDYINAVKSLEEDENAREVICWIISIVTRRK